jgi:hypothetical protein
LICQYDSGRNYGAGASLLGGSMQSKAAGDAARQSAQAQLESARIAAEAAKFRPVGVTTRYGTSNFQFDPEWLSVWCWLHSKP